MELKELEYFKVIVESGSILKASTILHIAQPPLSRMVKNLEKELNTKLFERGKTLTLLPPGKILYEKALMILAMKDDIIREIELQKNEEKILKIGIVSSSTNILYNHTIEEFHKDYPDIKLIIREANTYQLTELLKSRSIDLAIVRTPFDTSIFHTQFFYQEPMILLSKSKIQKNIEINYLDNLPLIIYRRFKDILELLFKENNITLNIQALVDDAKTAILLSNTNLGYAVVPESAYFSFRNLNLNSSIINSNELKTNIGVIDRKGEHLKKEYEIFISYLKKAKK